MPFINPTFLLHSDAARRLYETYAAPQPIIDYHSHLPPKDIAENRRFENLFEIWLEGDHYKWRAMRANGVDERYSPATRRRTRSSWPGPRRCRAACAIRSITGRTSSWRATSGSTICSTRRQRRSIWRRANERLACRRAEDARHPAAVRRHGAVHDRRSGRAADLARPPSATRASRPAVYPDLPPGSRAATCTRPTCSTRGSTGSAAVADVDIVRLRRSCSTRCAQRHQAFHDIGGRLSDHGLLGLPTPTRAPTPTARATFDRARSGRGAARRSRRGPSRPT